MPNSSAYARWLNACLMARKDATETEAQSLEEVLAFLSVKGDTNQVVKVTDLVNFLEFGTGPTVLRKITLLAEKGLIKVATIETDRRAKRIMLTKAGEDLLKERTKQMVAIVKA